MLFVGYQDDFIFVCLSGLINVIWTVPSDVFFAPVSAPDDELRLLR